MNNRRRAQYSAYIKTVWNDWSVFGLLEFETYLETATMLYLVGRPVKKNGYRRIAK